MLPMSLCLCLLNDISSGYDIKGNIVIFKLENSLFWLSAVCFCFGFPLFVLFWLSLVDKLRDIS